MMDNNITLTCTRCHMRARFQTNIYTNAAERAGWRKYNTGSSNTGSRDIILCPHCDYRLMEFLGQLKAY